MSPAHGGRPRRTATVGGTNATVLAQAGPITGDAERADALLGWSHAHWWPLQF
jgi:hypothetical protein